MRSTTRYLVITGLIGLLLLASTTLFVKGVVEKQKDETWSRLQQTGILRVGTDASYPPFETLDGEGNIVGLDADLAYAIGEQLGLQTVLVNITYDGLSDALISGQVDVLISALVPPPQLEGKARFSMPYFNAGDVLVLPSHSSIETMDDLAGHALAVEYGSNGDVEARKWERRLSGMTIRRYPTADAAIEAVLSGEVDAALTDGIAAQLAVSKHSELALGSYITEALFVVVLPKDSPTLEKEVNSILDEMLRDGTIGRLIRRWFGP
ncbi:MAG: amino acid ABC transporter substrate-binding protein [Anaerolineae bacterium]|nr:amino acid ABC transporter substrate-binding protein [Anaerolineae bacterium]